MESAMQILVLSFFVVAVVSQTWLGTAVSDETEGDNSKHDSSPFNDIDPSSDLYKKLKEQSDKFIPGRSFDEASFDDEHFANYDPYVDGRYPDEADRFFDPDRYPAKGHYGAKYDDSYEPYSPYDYNYDSRGPYPGGLSSNPYHSSSPCSNLPGGLTRMATGVDITKLELFNIESNQPGGFKGPIIDFSCEEGKMWTNSYNSRTYQVPDEIWKIDNVPGESINRVATVFRSYEEIKQYLLELTGLEEKNGMFSLSKSFSELTKEVELDSKMIVDVTSHLFNTEIMMEPHQTIPLGFHVESFLATLADDYEDEPEGYEEFIETFGTHYYSSATVGPFIRNQFSVSEKYYLEHNEANIKQESLNWFTNWYDSHANKKTAKLNIDKNFEASTVSRAEIYGGQSEIFEDKGVDGWLETAVDVPTIFKGKLTPISNLIDDPRIKASMERAVQIHLDRAFLTELKEGLEITEKKYQKGKIQNLVKIHEEVQKMAKSKVLDHDLLTMWGKTVKSSLAVPKWWQQTYLCYKYSNDVQNKYCSGPTPTCAPVNQFTELYQDWSRKAGGCHMQWGLFTHPEADDWFKNVEFCFRFSSEGDVSQCGDGKAKEICTKVNHYSPEYYDHSDRRKGGCQMQWKIYAKNTDLIPAWFANTKLCYMYKAHIKMKSNPRELKRVCSFVNEYTPAYLDDSHFHTYLRYTENFIQWGLTDVLG